LIKSQLSCNSDNVIYVITCTLCNLYYIGQTQNQLRTRLGQHLSDIKLKNDTSIANHFNIHSDPFSVFRITPLIKITDRERRKALEMKFIRFLILLNQKASTNVSIHIIQMITLSLL